MSTAPHQTSLSFTLALLGPLLEMSFHSPQRKGAPLALSPKGGAPSGATVGELVGELPGEVRWSTPSPDISPCQASNGPLSSYLPRPQTVLQAGSIDPSVNKEGFPAHVKGSATAGHLRLWSSRTWWQKVIPAQGAPLDTAKVCLETFPLISSSSS